MIDNPPPPVGYSGPDWYVDPAGRPNWNGSLAYPWDLQTALDKSDTILPGQTLWLRGGTYSGDFTCSLAGETDNRVVIRPYPDETPIIDGALELGASAEWVKLWVPRIINSNTYRGTESDPPDTNDRTAGLNILAPNCQVIGGMVLDTGVSIGNWSAGAGTSVYGVLALNGGWVNSTRWHGHGIYTQNNTGTRSIKHCIFGPHFGRTLACYANDGVMTGHRIDSNVWIERSIDEPNTLLMGVDDDISLDDEEFTNNHVVGAMAAQYLSLQNGELVFTGNTIWQPNDYFALLIGYWLTLTVTGNKINGLSPVGDAVIKEMIRWTRPDDDTGMVNDWDNNEYHYLGSEPKMFKADGTLKTFAEWQAATGFDAASSYDAVDTLPDSATVWPNEYKDENDPRCGIVVIWNGSSLDSVDVDLTSLSLTNGATYQIIQALDPLVDITTFEFATGEDVTFDMRASEHTLANPVGWPNPLTDETFPRFGAFLIEEV